MKRFGWLLVALALLCAPMACADAAPDAPVRVTVFHTNDVHGRVNEYIGYARLAALVNAERASGANVLLLDAGDTLHGMSYATLEKGERIVELMNLLGYDAMTPGNHDYNYGYARLVQLSMMMNNHLLSSNVTTKDGQNAFLPYIVLTKGGKRVAVVGASNPLLPDSIKSDYVSMLDFGGMDAVKSAVAQADAESDAVIVLAHWGAGAAFMPDSTALAAIEGVDLVIDGHSHSLTENIRQTEGCAPVVSAGEYMQNVGRLELVITDGGVMVENIQTLTQEQLADMTPDEKVTAVIDEVKNAQTAILGQVIAHTDVLLDGERQSNRTTQTNLGNLSADALRAYADTDIAVLNGGSIRITVNPGDITVGDMVNLFPFGNTVAVLEVTGAQVRAMMEHSLRQLPEASGGFLQFSGMKVTYDASLPAGARVTGISIGGEPLDDARAYTLATNDYIAACNSGYDMLKDAVKLLELGTVDEAVVAYMQALGSVAYTTDDRLAQVSAQ